MQPRTAVTGHLVWGTLGNVKGLAFGVAALLTIDDCLDGAFEHLEVLILLRVEVLRRKSALTAVGALHLKYVRRDPEQLQREPVGTYQFLTLMCHALKDDRGGTIASSSVE